LLRIAEFVELYNVDYADDAVIYAELSAPSVFSMVPTIKELGVAIGNVGAHEAGHPLGL
jgi:predicted transcriptional regulator